jgi:hypothetical protein
MAALTSIAGPHGLRRRPRARSDATASSKSDASVVPADDLEEERAQSEEIVFSTTQCVKTFLYEALPMYSSLPVILFIECVLGKRSIGAALTLARNRMLYLTTWKGAIVPLPGQILLYLLPNWCMVCGIVIWSRDVDAQQLFDPWEILVMWLVVLMRHFVVAVKYGYLPASEIAAQYSKQYGALQLAKGIFMGGWANPRAPGFDIIEREVDTAMWSCDVDLHRCPLRLRLSDDDTAAPGGYPETMTAHNLGMRIALRCYGKPLAASAIPIALLTGIALPFLPAIARAVTGLPAFGGGMSWGPKLVAFCQIWGPFSYIWLMCGYHRLSLHSYNRRAKAMELFDELCSVGIASTELDSQESEAPPGPGPEPETEPETTQPEAELESTPLDANLAGENLGDRALAPLDGTKESPRLDLNAAEASLITPRSNDPDPGPGPDLAALSPKAALPSAHIAFDLTDPTTVVSVILLRRCLRHYVR